MFVCTIQKPTSGEQPRVEWKLDILSALVMVIFYISVSLAEASFCLSLLMFGHLSLQSGVRRPSGKQSSVGNSFHLNHRFILDEPLTVFVCIAMFHRFNGTITWRSTMNEIIHQVNVDIKLRSFSHLLSVGLMSMWRWNIKELLLESDYYNNFINSYRGDPVVHWKE